MNIVDVENIPSPSELNRMIREERQEMSDTIRHFYTDLGCTVIRNYAPPGLGKSHLVAELIYTHWDDKFVVVIPDHDMAIGDGDFEDMLTDRHINFIHIYGKTQPHRHYDKYCLRKNGEEYYPGCSCELNRNNYEELTTKYSDTYDIDEEDGLAKCIWKAECPYKDQFRDIDNHQVIICVLEHVARFDQRVLVFDESFEQKLLSTKILLPSDIVTYSIALEGIEYKKLGHKTFTFWKDVTATQDIIVDSAKSYFMKDFFENIDSVSAFLTDDGKICLFGRKNNYLPDYTRLIFNCATTPLRLMRNITNTEEWEDFSPENDGWGIYKSTRFSNMKLNNPIIKFKHNWGKGMAEKWLSLAVKYFGMIGDNLLIVTKLAMKQEIKDKFPDSTFVHFNAGRGYNSADRENGYDALIQYGRFGFTPLNREMFKLIGFDDKLVDEMEQSEMLQCLHRGRPILHPNMPIILMSDRKLFPNIKPLSIKLFGLFYEYYDIEFDVSYKKVKDRIGTMPNTKIKQFEIFVKFIREHVYKFDDSNYEKSDLDYVGIPAERIKGNSFESDMDLI